MNSTKLQLHEKIYKQYNLLSVSDGINGPALILKALRIEKTKMWELQGRLRGNKSGVLSSGNMELDQVQRRRICTSSEITFEKTLW